MAEQPWLLYGATGFTGRLIALEAVKRGHYPLLAGRSAEKLGPLARELGLEWKAFSLDNPTEVENSIRGFKLVFHAAGPFIHTSQPMLRACLNAGVHYVDITGEIPVLENTFRCDQEAKERQIALISGAGFDVIPSDCLALYAANRTPGAQMLETAVAAVGSASAGTIKSSLHILAGGGLVRRNGKLESVPLGRFTRRISFSDHPRTAIIAPWGDLSTAYRSTGIPNITCYLAQPSRSTKLVKIVGPIITTLLKISAIRGLASTIVTRSVKGPEEKTLKNGKSYLWARAMREDGSGSEAWLETGEAYMFTALTAPLVVERVLGENLTGAFSPAQAFGEDFVLEIPGTHRLDTFVETEKQ